MKNRAVKIISLFCLFIMLATTGASCVKGGDPAAQAAAAKKITLKVWAVYDDSETFAPLISDYKKVHPNVTVEFRQLAPEEYEQELLKAFALDEGPDIFAVHNTWTREYYNLLSPMPASVNVPVKAIVGTLKKEEVVSMSNIKLYSPLQIKTMFGDTVMKDVVMDFNSGTADAPKMVPRVYGLPLSLDTMVLYFNRDLLDKAGIATPAKYWTDLQAQIPKLRKLDSNGEILVAGAPVGTAMNVAGYFDILSLLMMQLKTVMISDDGQVEIAKTPRELSEQGISMPPGVNALEFYTSFADPSLESFTWSEKMPGSFEAFITGRSAYFLGYSFHRPLIQARAPKLNFEVAPMLQIQGYDTLNFANYWIYGVANKAKDKDFSWDFVRYIASKDGVTKYLEKAKKPAALRDMYEAGLENEDLQVATEQTLTAKTWYRGYDAAAAEKIFADMINQQLLGEATTKEILSLAADKIQQTMRKK